MRRPYPGYPKVLLQVPLDLLLDPLNPQQQEEFVHLKITTRSLSGSGIITNILSEMSGTTWQSMIILSPIRSIGKRTRSFLSH